MVAEPTTTTYSDANITAFIEARQVPDVRGVDPLTWDYSTTPPTRNTNENWIPTYDLNAAAADIWDEKAAAVAADFDFSADGASYSRSQKIAQCNQMASKYRSKSVPGGVRFAATQREVTVLGNIVETAPLIDRAQYDEVFNR